MADFYTELDNLREIASENKEKALKKAKDLGKKRVWTKNEIIKDVLQRRILN